MKKNNPVAKELLFKKFDGIGKKADPKPKSKKVDVAFRFFRLPIPGSEEEIKQELTRRYDKLVENLTDDPAGAYRSRRSRKTAAVAMFMLALLVTPFTFAVNFYLGLGIGITTLLTSLYLRLSAPIVSAHDVVYGEKLPQ